MQSKGQMPAENTIEPSRKVDHRWMYGCLAIVLLAVAAGPFLFRTGGGVDSSWWLVPLLLICPLSMFFMMRHGNGGHGHRD